MDDRIELKATWENYETNDVSFEIYLAKYEPFMKVTIYTININNTSHGNPVKIMELLYFIFD